MTNAVFFIHFTIYFIFSSFHWQEKRNHIEYFIKLKKLSQTKRDNFTNTFKTLKSIKLISIGHLKTPFVTATKMENYQVKDEEGDRERICSPRVDIDTLVLSNVEVITLTTLSLCCASN